MRTRIAIAAGIALGFGLGAFSIHTLHAQGKPAIYLITEIDVTNADAYSKEFAPKAQATIKAAGAKFVLIGGTAGAGAKPITAMAGTPPKRITVQQWESMEAMKTWYNGKINQYALKFGQKHAPFR